MVSRTEVGRQIIHAGTGIVLAALYYFNILSSLAVFLGIIAGVLLSFICKRVDNFPIVGWFLKNLKWSIRIIYLFSALMMIAPEWRSDLVGLVLGFLMIGITFINYKKEKNSEKLKNN